MADLNSTVSGNKFDMEKLLASLGRSGDSRGKRKGMWFDVGGGTEEFVSFRRFSDREIEFKEYDELGMEKEGGFVVFDEREGKVEYTLNKKGTSEEIVEGWLAFGWNGERVEVFTAWRLVSEVEAIKWLMRVLTGYLHLKEAEFEQVGEKVEFEMVGAGLSGEEEGKAEFGVIKRGKLKRTTDG